MTTINHETTVHETTNGHWRPLIDGDDLTPAEKRDLDYVDWAAVEAGTESWVGFRYRGNLYDLDEFTPAGNVDHLRNPWEGASAQSAFDAVVIIFGYDADVLVGHLHW